ncbi:MAG: hypothetical protein ACXW1P_09040 [Methylophilaceae bacterium]
MLGWLSMPDEVHAAEIANRNPPVEVVLVESEDERCVANDGKMISLEAKNLPYRVAVWVDRWFMEVQTADHTKHLLSARLSQAALGCSNTNSGHQHWTIHSVYQLD